MRGSTYFSVKWNIGKVPLADPGGIHFYNNDVRDAMSGSIRPLLRDGLNTGELSPDSASFRNEWERALEKSQ
jgi:hypothetical protein